ncbi:hypothetical protein AB0L53_21990 [Nonomuraea sp. NPDC052129]|uniref:hypothetical protein n=1 Tax=Nonomuraea sp. NPDC052129 TaxID=3154651 RepID=UPI00342E6426
MARGLGMKKVREELGLAVWEVELAVETSLLRRLPDRTFDPVSVNAAKADAERFQRLLAAEQAAVDAAIRAATRLSDASVAELFSLPVDVIRQLRPGSGRWSAQHVAGLLRNPPPWLSSESAALAEPP